MTIIQISFAEPKALIWSVGSAKSQTKKVNVLYWKVANELLSNDDNSGAVIDNICTNLYHEKADRYWKFGSVFVVKFRRHIFAQLVVCDHSFKAFHVVDAAFGL